MTEVEVRGVRAGYQHVDVLAGVDLTVPSGTFAAILGASGSGKTTLLRVLAGFLRPSAGAVFFGGREVAGPGVFVPPEKRRVGIVPQEGALFPHLDVRGNVAFGLTREQRAGSRVDDVLNLVGMADYATARPQELSGGQQQRVAVARALAPQPDVVLLDEPFSALDAGLRARIREDILQVLRDVGTTSILVTHDQEEALSTADLVAVMNQGRIVQVSTPQSLYGAPVDLATARFVGDVVELPVLAEGTPGLSGQASVMCSLGEVQLDEVVDEIVDESEAAAQTGVDTDVIVLRPEQLELSLDADSPCSREGVAGRVISSRFHGHDAMIEVRLHDDAVVEVRLAGATPPAVGEQVWVCVRGAGRRYRGGRAIT